MFEKFTENAIKAIMLAQEEARRLGHNFVGTEQLLLGLIAVGPSAAVLKSLGVTLKDARVEVEKIIGRGSGFVAIEIPFTPRAKRMLDLAYRESQTLGHDHISPLHLLLGMVAEPEGVAMRVLVEKLGVDRHRLRSGVIRLMGEQAILSPEQVEKANVIAALERWIERLKSDDPEADHPEDVTTGVLYVPENKSWTSIAPVRAIATGIAREAIKPFDMALLGYAQGYSAAAEKFHAAVTKAQEATRVEEKARQETNPVVAAIVPLASTPGVTLADAAAETLANLGETDQVVAGRPVWQIGFGSKPLFLMYPDGRITGTAYDALVAAGFTLEMNGEHLFIFAGAEAIANLQLAREVGGMPTTLDGGPRLSGYRQHGIQGHPRFAEVKSILTAAGVLS